MFCSFYFVVTMSFYFMQILKYYASFPNNFKQKKFCKFKILFKFCFNKIDN